MRAWFQSICSSIAVLPLATLAISGCTSIPYPRHDLPPESAALIKRLTILRVDDPEQLVVPLDIGTGQAVTAGLFGPLGVAFIAAKVALRVSERAGPFTNAIATEEPSFADLMVEELTHQLTIRNIDVTYLKSQRALPRGGTEFDYTGSPTDTDALLHVRFLGIGYGNDTSAFDCVPRVGATAILLNPKSRQKIFQRSFSAGFTEGPVRELHVLPDDRSPRFSNFEILLASPKPAAEALRVRVKSIAQHVVASIIPSVAAVIDNQNAGTVASLANPGAVGISLIPVRVQNEPISD